MSSKRFFVAVLLCGFIALLTLGLSGCASSGHPIGVALTPSSTQSIDQAQTVAITATVTHDSKSAGVTWTVSGGGTLSPQTTTSATYNTPASVTSAFTATVTATSVTDTTKSATLQIKVSALPTITTTSLPAATAGTAYSQTLSESGGTSPYTWSITAGTLPPGLSLNASTGVISGTPTGGGSGSVTFQVTDAAGMTASQAITFTVNPPPALTITTTSLPAGTIGTAYSQTLAATGGVPSYTWSKTAGSLPAGLTLSSAGVISGTPSGTVGGTYSFTVTVTDSQTPTPATANAGLSITISIAPLTITTTSPLPSGTVGTAYSDTVNATGGVTPYAWSVSGSVPAWLSINPTTGVLSGTPTAAATSTFTVTVTDSESPAQATTGSLSITINAQAACTGTNNNLLKGNYAVMLNGWSSATTAASAVGSFVADGTTGTGNISGGSIDIADQNHNAPETGTVTGTYCVDSNNLATINITIAGGPGGNSSPTFEAALDASDGNGHIVEYDTSGFLLSGVLRKQDTTAFSTSKITGNYAFGMVGADNSGHAGSFAVAGEFNSNGSGTISGESDVDDAGTVLAQQTFSASDFSVASTGRGTVTITSSNGNTNYVLYVVSASELLMMAADTKTPPMIMAGQVLQQSGSFTNASLNGISVIEDQYLDGGTTPAASVGLLTTDGAGSFSVSIDVNDGGTMGTQTPSGNYSVEPATGRVTVSGAGAGNHPPVFYLVGPNQAFLVGTGGSPDFGTITPQTGSNFTNASLTGNYLGGSQPPVSANMSDEVDSVNADGAGTLTGTSDSNGSGGPHSSGITATYSVSSNGRVVVTNSNAQAGIIYIISASQFVFLPASSSDTAPDLTDFHK